MSRIQYTKVLSIVLVALALNGCALYDALMMTNFDSNEYLLVTQIRTDAQVYKTQCENPALAPVNAQAIALKTKLFQKGSNLLPVVLNLQIKIRLLDFIITGAEAMIV